MNTYTLTGYLDDVRVGFGTVLEDHPLFHLVGLANEWFGEHNWNRLELSAYKEDTE